MKLRGEGHGEGSMHGVRMNDQDSPTLFLVVSAILADYRGGRSDLGRALIAHGRGEKAVPI